MTTLTSPYEDIAAALQMDPWARRAACNNLDALATLQCHDRLPDGTRDENAARQLCAGCPVRGECRAWVLGLPERDDPDDLWICDCKSCRMTRRRAKERAAKIATPAPAGTPDTKPCKRCGETLPWYEYWADNTSPDGRARICRYCRGARKQAAA